MTYEGSRREYGPASQLARESGRASVGKQTLTMDLPSAPVVQLKRNSADGDSEQASSASRSGVGGLAVPGHEDSHASALGALGFTQGNDAQLAGPPSNAAPSSSGKGGGRPLPANVRSPMESSFGTDFSAVRVHEDGLAESVDAQAYAQGTDIHFAPGRYDPGSQQGLELLGHELTHVVQQSQGRASQPTQSKSNSVNDDSALEREADTLGAKAARGEYVGMGGGTSTPAGVIQRKTTVNPIASARKDKRTVLGDGTPGNRGLSIPALDAYLKAQADWFTEPSFAPGDRDAVWKVAAVTGLGSHVSVALASFHTGDVAALAPAELTKLKKYVTCFDANAQTIQMTTKAATMARALQFGQAIIDLEAFVPTPVLKIVIPESGLFYLVDKLKLTELQRYYTTFKPTLETQAEWTHVVRVLDEGVAKYAPLAGWIHDLHIFTVPTRDQLLKNIGNKSRSLPVMLILFSASDWNTAFLQGALLEKSVTNANNLALIIQGMGSLAAASAEVTRVADDYGQQSLTWDPRKSWLPQLSPGRLGQVVIAGHGSEQTVEMASPGTGAWADEQNHRVGYDQKDIDSSDPKKNGTELLFDTVISRMDPADANIVFAGCLVGSHDIPKNTPVSGKSATTQKNLQDALKKHPNLADYVRSRMAAASVTGTVQASNASTTFDSFNVDPVTGRAQLSNPGDPDVSGSKLQYVRTGIEAEGALRAALECYADAAIGPAKTTTEVRTRVAGLAANTSWNEVITRTAFELCLPAAGDVSVSKLLDVVHRVRPWGEIVFENTADPQDAANNVKPAEAPKVFAAMLGTSDSAQEHVQVDVNEMWMKFDAGKAVPFMAALTASAFTRETFKKHLARGVVALKLATLLPVGAPTKGQLLLALTIAWQDGQAMPNPVRDFLRAAAGGTKTTTFPAALGVPALLDPVNELDILEGIGLAPSSVPGPGGSGSVDGNVDANGDNKNETYIQVSPRETTVTASQLNVRDKPGMSGKIVDTLNKGDPVRVMGETMDHQWSFVDHGGKTGFMATRYLA